MRIIRIVSVVFCVVGAAMLTGALVLFLQTRGFLHEAVVADGMVVRLDRLGDGTFRPVVHFQTARGQRVEFTTSASSDPPMYDQGELVKVRYLAAEPSSARIDGFASLWLAPVILSGMGTVFASIGGGIMVGTAWRRRREADLKRSGVPIETDFQSVIRDPSLEVNGMNPFRIVTQWQDPSTSQIHLFRSDAIWFDPTKYIPGKKLTVYIRRGNPRSFVVDLSFLPEVDG